MQCNQCSLCGELFWCRDEDTEICVTCIESPDEERQRQQAAERAVAYMQCRRKN